tara:strand:+ start:376 stop:597 length:222 start_codon:yes stop_codon:yes gene_type:complete
VTHGEYEILKALLDSNIIAESVEMVKYNLVPANDDIADNRFETAIKSVATLISNMADRRLHRIPKNHPDYKVK